MDNLLQYENLVYSIVRKYGKGYDNEDLYQVGMLGLLEASKRFDVSQSIKFSTYAYYYVMGEVVKFIRENKSIKLSKDLVKLNRSINHAYDVMSQKLGRNPTTTELSVFLEVPEKNISEALLMTQEVESLDYSYDDSSSLYNKISCNNINDDLIDLKDELMKLSTEERGLIIDRYFEELTQSEVSKKTGESQVQVSRRESKVLQKLRSRL